MVANRVDLGKNKKGTRILKKKGLGTRERVLLVAQAEFLKRGYGECTLDQIAEAAVLAKGTIYQYFSGKDELMEVLRHRFFRDFNAFLAGYFPAPGELSRLDVPTHLPETRPEHIRLSKQVQPRNRLEMRQYLTRFFGALSEFFQTERDAFRFFLGERWYKNPEIYDTLHILERYIQNLQIRGLSKSNVSRSTLPLLLLSSWVQLVQKWAGEGKGRLFNISHTDDFVNMSLDLLRVDA